MRQEVILPSLRRRLADRGNLVLALLIGGMFCLLRMLDGRHPPSAVEWLLPFLMVFFHLTLAPVPWQWAAEPGRQRSFARGLMLSVVFNAVWIAALFLAARAFLPAPDPFRLPPEWPAHLPPPPFRPRPLNPGWGLGLINLAFAMLVGGVLAEKEAVEARERETAGLLRQAEAKALQNQLEPHVLYNALSSLAELIHEDPLAAEEVATQLADLYRSLTRHGKRDRVTLGEERRLVEAYLAMEQMRLGERLRVAWTWPPWAEGVSIPPFFLQPLVENAIKHGIGPCDAGGDLRISCSRQGARISLRVENTGVIPPENGGQGAQLGIGLGNLEARLALWHEAGGAFQLTREGGWSVALLSWNAAEGA